MPTAKLAEFLKQLHTSNKGGGSLVTTIDAPLVQLLIDILTPPPSPHERQPLIGAAMEFIELCKRAQATDEPVSVRLSPALCTRWLDQANTNFRLQSMREFIAERIIALNPARGHNPTSDKAIDDICLAIEAGNDPNANIEA